MSGPTNQTTNIKCTTCRAKSKCTVEIYVHKYTIWITTWKYKLILSNDQRSAATWMASDIKFNSVFFFCPCNTNDTFDEIHALQIMFISRYFFFEKKSMLAMIALEYMSKHLWEPHLFPSYRIIIIAHQSLHDCLLNVVASFRICGPYIEMSHVKQNKLSCKSIRKVVRWSVIPGGLNEVGRSYFMPAWYMLI